MLPAVEGGTMSRIVVPIGLAVVRRAACGVLLIALSFFTMPGLFAADIVTDWNATPKLVAPRFGGPQQQSRVQAMVQIAVHDALNAIESRYERYAYHGVAAAGASPDAAVAAAARQTLLGLLATLPDSALVGRDRDRQNRVHRNGRSGASRCRNAGRHRRRRRRGGGDPRPAHRMDGSDTPHLPYTLLPAPGVYQPTPNPEFPAAIVPSFAGWANVTTFVLNHSAQFEVEPGADSCSAGLGVCQDYNEVKQVGDARVRGALPDSEESDIARFWPGGGSNWNLTTRVIVSGMTPRSLAARAVVRAVEPRPGRCTDRQSEVEVHLQLLAARHRDPLSGRWQRRDGERSRVASVHRDAALSRLSRARCRRPPAPAPKRCASSSAPTTSRWSRTFNAPAGAAACADGAAAGQD